MSFAPTSPLDSELEKKRRVKGFGEAQAETANFILNAPARVSREALSVEAIARGRDITKAHYYARSEGLMDERLWRDVANGEEIDRRYWTRRLAREEPKRAWFGVEEFEAGENLHRSLETYHMEIQARQDFPGLHPYRARNTYRRLSLENPRNPVYPKLWVDMEWAIFWRFDAAASAYAEAVRRAGRGALPEAYRCVAERERPGGRDRRLRISRPGGRTQPRTLPRARAPLRRGGARAGGARTL